MRTFSGIGSIKQFNSGSYVNPIFVKYTVIYTAFYVFFFETDLDKSC